MSDPNTEYEQTPHPVTINNVLRTSPNSTGGCLQKAFKYIAIAIASIVGFILLVIILTFAGLRSFFDSVLDLFSPNPPIAVVADTQTILSGIQTNAQFVSYTVQLAKANITVNVEQRGLLNNNFCGYSGTYVAQGTIRAGIDLSSVTEDHVTYDEATEMYHVMLPAAQLTSCSVDYVDQYAGTTTLCPGIDWDENRQLAQYWALTQFKNDAIEGQILDEAEKRASEGLNNFVSSLTGKAVEITFAPDLSTPPDNTCQGEAPLGWVQNAETGIWSKP